MFIILSSGCKKVDKYTQFEMDYQDTITIPSSVGVNMPYDMWTPEITTNSEGEFAVRDTRSDMVEDIRMKSLNLEVVSPDDGNLRFLNDIWIYLNADGLEEVKVAWKEDISDDVGSSLDLITADHNLEAYLKKENIAFRVKTVTDKIITHDHDILLNAVFWVDAEVLGQ